MRVIGFMKHYPPERTQDRSSEAVLVLAPTRHEGIGRALRSAYRGGADRLPPDIQDLLDQLN